MCIQVQDRAADANRAVTEADKTHKRAKDLNSEVDKLRKKIQGEGHHQYLGSLFLPFFNSFLDRDCGNSESAFCCVFEDLLQKLKETGTTLPSEDLAKMLRDAEGMVKEMEKRNFTPQKTAAEKEKDEAKKCKTSSDLHLFSAKTFFKELFCLNNRPLFSSAGVHQG